MFRVVQYFIPRFNWYNFCSAWYIMPRSGCVGKRCIFWHTSVLLPGIRFEWRESCVRMQTIDLSRQRGRSGVQGGRRWRGGRVSNLVQSCYYITHLCNQVTRQRDLNDLVILKHCVLVPCNGFKDVDLVRVAVPSKSILGQSDLIQKVKWISVSVISQSRTFLFLEWIWSSISPYKKILDLAA